MLFCVLDFKSFEKSLNYQKKYVHFSIDDCSLIFKNITENKIDEMAPTKPPFANVLLFPKPLDICNNNEEKIDVIT